ncbi:MAG: Na+/H+ antiporter NhaA [Gammaproteobacteria bacterium]
MPFSLIREFLRLEAAAGILLMVATVAALLASNTPLAVWYDRLLIVHLSVLVDGVGIDKPLFLWVNDGLMAVFFLLVGLEIKREVLEGELSSRAQILLPGLGALGGFVLPALIYLAFTHDDPLARQGWAIPAATDIAFALGVLSLLGSRVPQSLRMFLTSLAIFDDLGAIIVIAIFYTADLSLGALALAGAGTVALVALNRSGVRSITPYVLIGLVVWVGVLKSGVHATLAGVVVALCIPLAEDARGHSPLRWLEHALHPWVAYLVLPVFAFVNAGVPFRGLDPALLVSAVPLGIAVGLFVGKQVGVFGICWLAIRLGLARLPEGADWRSFYGVCVLAGIGFTMSLFIGNLAFEHGAFDYVGATRIGVLLGSLAAALAGSALLLGGAARRAAR